MKKIFILAGLAFSMSAIAQKIKDYTGNVGINTETPQATLQIVAKDADNNRPDGILIPKLTSAQASAKKALTTEGTLLYITDDVKEGEHFVGAGKGFYYYDEAKIKWVKIGSGSAAVPTNQDTFLGKVTGNIRSIPVPVKASDFQGTDFAIVATSGGLESVELPSPSGTNSSRVISINNQSGGDITFAGDNPPLNASMIAPGYGHLLMSNGANWVVIGGLY